MTKQLLKKSYYQLKMDMHTNKNNELALKHADNILGTTPSTLWILDIKAYFSELFITTHTHILSFTNTLCNHLGTRVDIYD